MGKDRDKDPRRGPDPLRDLYKRGIGERIKDAGRAAFDKVRRNPLKKTPPEKLQLTEGRPTLFELEMADRPKWVADSKQSLERRERVERAALSRIYSFAPQRWIPASIEERIVALQALETRLRKIQGRTESYRVTISDRLKTSGAIDHKTRTIGINSKLIDRANARHSIAALFMQLHLAMQQDAVKNPAAFAEHSIGKIQEWADRKDGKYSFSRKDAVSYAKRQTAHLR